MRSLVVCIFVLQSFQVMAENALNHVAILEQSHVLFENNNTQNYHQQQNDLISNKSYISILGYKSLIFTHNRSAFKPAFFQAQEHNQVSLHYLHFGKSHPLSISENMWFYKGAGVTYFDSENGDYSDNTALSFSLGIHSQYIIGNNVTLSVDSKLYGTYLDGENKKYCVNNTCQLNQSNEFWIQKQVAINLQFSF